MSDWPLLNLILNLEGFAFAAFLLSAVVRVFFYRLRRRLPGRAARNGAILEFLLCDARRAYAGLCAHDWWLRPYGAYEPYLTIVVVVGGLLATVLAVTAVALR
jgi:hypothetical protein